MLDSLAVSPADSAVVHQVTAGIIGSLVDLILSHFQGIDPAVASKAHALAPVAAVFVVNVLLAGLRLGMVKVGDILGPNSLIVRAWDTHRGWLNVALAFVLGQLGGGSAMLGAASVALHAGYRGAAKAIGNATPQDIARSARTAGMVLLALVGLAGAARAGAVQSLTKPLTASSLPVSPWAKERFAFSLALGAKANGWIYSRGTEGFVEGQAAYQVTNAVGLRLGVRHLALSRVPYEPEAKIVLTFAP